MPKRWLQEIVGLLAKGPPAGPTQAVDEAQADSQPDSEGPDEHRSGDDQTDAKE
jgi:hypothetical protein